MNRELSNIREEDFEYDLIEYYLIIVSVIEEEGRKRRVRGRRGGVADDTTQIGRSSTQLLNIFSKMVD